MPCFESNAKYKVVDHGKRAEEGTIDFDQKITTKLPTIDETISDRMKKAEIVKEAILTVSSLEGEKLGIQELILIAKANTANQTGKELLQVDSISTGYSNYCYKISLLDDPTVKLFAKLSFSHVSWNDGPEKFDLGRSDCEFEIMDRLQSVFEESNMPTPVAKPYFCKSLMHENEEMKLLVTEWAVADEPMANQFVRGKVDPRIAPQLANALATLHTLPFDPDFNKDTPSFYNRVMEASMVPYLMELACIDENVDNGPKTANRMKDYARTNIGLDKMKLLTDRLMDDFHSKECLIHCDAHTHNMLVERSVDGKFGPLGAITICDWEICSAGQYGRDFGMVLSWPLYCAMAHAFCGRTDAVKECLAFVSSFRDTYLNRIRHLMEARKDTMGLCDESIDSRVRDIFQKGIAGSAVQMMHVYHMLDAFQDDLPFPDKTTREDLHAFKIASGLLALRFLEFGYLRDGSKSQSLNTLIEACDNIIAEEMRTLMGNKHLSTLQ